MNAQHKPTNLMPRVNSKTRPNQSPAQKLVAKRQQAALADFPVDSHPVRAEALYRRLGGQHMDVGDHLEDGPLALGEGKARSIADSLRSV